ncbi:hypothetical protein A0H81_09940 [Grifola frondosa]|uniref:Uncharacterized protein n=1 Tax=Grifola frondosa TaxID=5627 RepID=A0A1C7LZA9_GRIFR|nr:hypothetical protein A0H81_09940 [Grifola frondosa]
MRLHLPAPHRGPAHPPAPQRLSPPAKADRPQPEPYLLTQKVQSELWLDGDEFGTRRRHPQPDSPLPSPRSSSSSHSSGSRRTHRRAPSIASNRARSHSPPPARMCTSPPPPVPPIPSFALATPGAKRSVLRSPARSRPPQIVIPDLAHSSAHPYASPIRRTLGCESH